MTWAFDVPGRLTEYLKYVFAFSTGAGSGFLMMMRRGGLHGHTFGASCRVFLAPNRVTTHEKTVHGPYPRVASATCLIKLNQDRLARSASDLKEDLIDYQNEAKKLVSTHLNQVDL